MKKRAEILEELTNLKSALGNGEHPIQSFQVPEGYFEGLSGQILANVKASFMETECNIPINKQEPFSVPAGYFEGLSNSILQQIKTIQPVIEGKVQSFDTIAVKETYQLPDHYFGSFEQHLFSKLGLNQENASEETQAISALVAGLKDKPSYQAPEAYFNAIDFSEKIQSRNIERKVVEHPSVKSIRWAGWAAAAAIVMIFFVGGFNFLTTNNTYASENKFEKSLAKIPEYQLREWLSNNLDETDVNNISASLLKSKDIKTQKALENITEADIEDITEN